MDNNSTSSFLTPIYPPNLFTFLQSANGLILLFEQGLSSFMVLGKNTISWSYQVWLWSTILIIQIIIIIICLIIILIIMMMGNGDANGWTRA